MGCLQTLRGHTDRVNSVRVTSDKCWGWALSGSSDRTVRLWEIASLTSEGDGLRPKPPLVLCRAVTAQVAADTEALFDHCIANGTAAVSEGRWGDALAHATKARSISGYESASDALRLAASAGLHSFRRRFLAGWHLRTFEGHTSMVSSVCMSSDNRLVLSGSWDHTLRLWDVADGKMPACV